MLASSIPSLIGKLLKKAKVYRVPVSAWTSHVLLEKAIFRDKERLMRTNWQIPKDDFYWYEWSDKWTKDLANFFYSKQQVA